MTASTTTTTARRITSSRQMLQWAAGGWCFFIAENAILSENRSYLIAALGDDKDEGRYHALYGTFSTVATASIIYAYVKLQREAVKATVRLPPQTPLVVMTASWMSLTLGLVLASQTLPKLQIPVALTTTTTTTPQQPSSSSTNPCSTTAASADPDPSCAPAWKLQVRCPFDFTDNKKKNNASSHDDFDATKLVGLERISRHPGLWSFGLISAAQAAWAPTTALQVWWMGPLAVAWLGGWHSDARFRRGMGGTLDPSHDSVTSNVPFGAVVTGRQGNPLEVLQQWMQYEMKPLNAVAAIVAATLFVVSKGRRIPR